MPYSVNETTQRLEINGVPVYASESSGYIDCIVRCADKATFDAVAESVNMLVRDEDGNLVAGPDVNIDRIGSVVVVPGTYDEDGSETAPPVLDNRYHVNYRLGLAALESGNWEAVILNWMTNGTQVVSSNKSEQALELLAVELIDPMSITTPQRIWL